MSLKKLLCRTILRHRIVEVYSDSQIRIQECSVCSMHWMSYRRSPYIRTDFEWTDSRNAASSLDAMRPRLSRHNQRAIAQSASRPVS